MQSYPATVAAMSWPCPFHFYVLELQVSGFFKLHSGVCTQKFLAVVPTRTLPRQLVRDLVASLIDSCCLRELYERMILTSLTSTLSPPLPKDASRSLHLFDRLLLPSLRLFEIEGHADPPSLPPISPTSRDKQHWRPETRVGRLRSVVS